MLPIKIIRNNHTKAYTDIWTNSNRITLLSPVDLIISEKSGGNVLIIGAAVELIDLGVRNSTDNMDLSKGEL